MEDIMSDPAAKPKKDTSEATQAPHDSLGEKDLEQVSGGGLGLDGVKGESQDAKFKDEIHIDS
jgi:hypothetical protein